MVRLLKRGGRTTWNISRILGAHIQRERIELTPLCHTVGTHTASKHNKPAVYYLRRNKISSEMTGLATSRGRLDTQMLGAGSVFRVVSSCHPKGNSAIGS